MVLKVDSDAADQDSFQEITECPEDLERTKNLETYFIPRDADVPGETRQYVSIAKCPFAEHCNEANFKKACVWSFQSVEMCMSYLMNHLWNKHSMNQGEGLLCIMCSDLKWEFGFGDRNLMV